MPRALLAAVLALATTCLAWAPVVATGDSAAEKAAAVAGLAKNLTAAEVAQFASLVAASSNKSAFTAWAGGEVVKQLPPPIPAYALPGPCTVAAKQLKGVVAAPKAFNLTGDGSGDEKKPATLLTTLTLPASCTPASNRTGPWPTVAFFSGFASPSALYASYAAHFASWGYAVLQYDLAAPVNLTPDAVELGFLGPAWAWAVKAAAEAGSPLVTSALLVAGHSRGGKLAALHYCGAGGGTTSLPPIPTAGLIDPVDNTLFSPESALYPSGVKCVAAGVAAGALGPVSLTGAGVVAACNPPGANYPTWREAVAPGSWTARLLKAGHATFINSKAGAINAAADAACVPGGLPHAVASDAAAGQVTAWFDGTVTPFADPAIPALQAAYVAWAGAQGKWMEWSVKQS